MMPKGKSSTATTIAAGGQLSSMEPPQYVQLLPVKPVYSSGYLSRHFVHHPYIMPGGSVAFNSAEHSHFAEIFVQKRHLLQPFLTHLTGFGGGLPILPPSYYLL